MIRETIDRFVARFAIPIAIALAALAVIAGLASGFAASHPLSQELADDVAPKDGVELPVVWGDLGRRLVESGAIDLEKWEDLYDSLSEEERRLLDGDSSDRLRITPENADYLLNLLWAFGLANSNPILDEGEMTNQDYGGAGGFASTGGWTLARGDAMQHYSAHVLMTLTKEQQALVEKISQGIYRPCCDNPTSFPDCNHGMAMLGLLELMASQGASEEEMWAAALAVNAYWFPDTYETIAIYQEKRGIKWGDVSPREVLGYDFSSASGYQRILSEVRPTGQSGASCSVQ